jgi:hypothetical protein
VTVWSRGWAVVGLLALTGCGIGAQTYPPTGIDELVIPTPSPRPADFVDRVDNQWFPLSPGRTWVYDVKRTGRPDGVRTVTVLAHPVAIAGVATTAVSAVLTRPGESPSTRIDYYAQDRAGNVWWFGQDGLWRAGREGAQAGLLMAAHPRLGDGYRAAYQKGRVEDVVTVAQVRPIVSLEVTTALSPGESVWDTYRKGIGLTDQLDTGTGEHEVLRTR